MFKKNIESAGIADVVKHIRNNSINIEWQLPVSFLFIDGLHDYINVSRDLRHFSDWLIPRAYIAFHDYARYFPGVIRFVEELFTSTTYTKFHQADSLIILQKL